MGPAASTVSRVFSPCSTKQSLIPEMFLPPFLEGPGLKLTNIYYAPSSLLHAMEQT